jgi:PadR family transcriptional regulator, regulatory protein PadR
MTTLTFLKVLMKSRQNQHVDLSPLEEIILMALLERQLYGLEIVRAVEEGSEGRRKLGFGSLYPTLHKLQRKGLVKSQWGEETPEERAGARRRYYETTALGRKTLKEMEQIRKNIAAWKPAWERA